MVTTISFHLRYDLRTDRCCGYENIGLNRKTAVQKAQGAKLLFVLYLFLRMIKMEAVSVTHLLIGEAVLFAIMAYVDILQRVDLVGPEYFYRVLLDTMSIAVISGIACVAARIWHRNHRS